MALCPVVRIMTRFGERPSGRRCPGADQSSPAILRAPSCDSDTTLATPGTLRKVPEPNKSHRSFRLYVARALG